MTEIDTLFEQLKELTSLTGVSGQEENVVKFLSEKLLKISDEVFIDPFGNISALRKGAEVGPTYMISAHSDEVGGVITSITEDGFLRFYPVGVVDPRIFPGIRLLIDQNMFGTTVCKPGHTSTHHDGQADFPGDLLIDIGATSCEQVHKWGVQPGSIISFVSPLIRMKENNLVMGKAIDNRIGCLILLQLFEKLQGVKFSGNLYGVVTVQEEIGMMGARMISNRLKPDFAIVLDTVPLDDTPLQSMPDVPINLGGGPVVQLRTGKDNVFLGTVAHKSVSELLFRTADEMKIKIQRAAAYGKWVTDAEAIHTSGEGIPTGFLSIPRRYGHTPNELIDLNDVSDAIEIIRTLVVKNASRFTPDFLKQ
jgi:putative aminopeptidase